MPPLESSQAALSRMQQTGRTLNPDDESAVALAAAAVSTTGNTTSGSPIITGIADTSLFCQVGKPDTWNATVSAGFASATNLIRILAKTDSSITLAANATSSQTGVTVASAQAYTPADETTAIESKSDGKFFCHCVNDPDGKISEFTLTANYPRGLRYNRIYGMGRSGNDGMAPLADLIPQGA